jgi:hypothetical protein
METPKVPDTARSEMSLIGESVVIKGELSCSEDLIYRWPGGRLHRAERETSDGRAERTR